MYNLRHCLLFLPLVVLAIPAEAQIQPNAACSNASLSGTYDYLFSGTVKSGNNNVAYDELGKIDFDGNGIIKGVSTVASTAGAIRPNTALSGTYTVSSDCSGSGSWIAGGPMTTFNFQLINGGDIALAALTVSGNVVDGRFYRAATDPGYTCGPGDLTGTYAFLLGGSTYSNGTATRYNLLTQAVFNGSQAVSLTGSLIQPSGTTAFRGSGLYSVSSDCTGTAMITFNGTVMNYAFARVQGGTVIAMETDANTAIDGSGNLQQLLEVLPQFVYGGGWYTALYFTNTGSTSVSFTVNFIDDNGNALNVPGVDGQITLGAHQTTIVEAKDIGALTQGYALASFPAGVTGYGVFRQLGQEAVVLFRDASTTSTSLTYDDLLGTTAVAIVNTSSANTTVTITAYDGSGNVAGTATLPLNAYNKVENTLKSYIPAVANRRGTVQFSVTNGTIAVIGLRFIAGSAFTSIPSTTN